MYTFLRLYRANNDISAFAVLFIFLAVSAHLLKMPIYSRLQAPAISVLSSVFYRFSSVYCETNAVKHFNNIPRLALWCNHQRHGAVP